MLDCARHRRPPQDRSLSPRVCHAEPVRSRDRGLSQPDPSDDLALRRERGARWLSDPPVTTLEGAGAFVAEHGLALLFPAERTVAPSLWEAVAGEDAEPFATGMGEAESRVWAWKDELPRD